LKCWASCSMRDSFTGLRWEEERGETGRTWELLRILARLKRDT